MKKLFLLVTILLFFVPIFQKCSKDDKEEFDPYGSLNNYLIVNEDAACLQSINFRSKADYGVYAELGGNPSHWYFSSENNNSNKISIEFNASTSGSYNLDVNSLVKIRYYPSANDAWSSHSGTINVSKYYVNDRGYLVSFSATFNCIVKHDSDTTEARCMNNGIIQWNQ